MSIFFYFSFLISGVLLLILQTMMYILFSNKHDIKKITIMITILSSFLFGIITTIFTISFVIMNTQIQSIQQNIEIDDSNQFEIEQIKTIRS
jgi:hypothetical protein